nr:G protein-coupled receptor [Proales similis]
MNTSQECIDKSERLSLGERICWRVVLPSICATGLLTNLACIYVFRRIKLTDKVFSYVLLVSVVDTFYLSSLGISFAFAATEDGWHESIVAPLLRVWLVDFFTSILAVFNILIEIYVSIVRLCTLSGFKAPSRLPILLVSVMATCLAILPYLPVIFYRRVEMCQLSSRVLFRASRSELATSTFIKILTVATSISRGPGTVLILFTLCVLTNRKRIQLSKRYGLEASGKMGNNNLTKMVMAICAMIIVGCLPLSVYSILIQFVHERNIGLRIFALSANIVLVAYHGARFFVYFFFNANFRHFVLNKSSSCQTRQLSSS